MISFNPTFQTNNYGQHPTTRTIVTSHVNTKTLGERFSHTISSVWNSLPHTHILPLDSPSSFYSQNTGWQQKDAYNDVRGPTKTVTGALSSLLLMMMMIAFI